MVGKWDISPLRRWGSGIAGRGKVGSGKAGHGGGEAVGYSKRTMNSGEVGYQATDEVGWWDSTAGGIWGKGI